MKAAIFDQFNGPVSVREISEPVCPKDGVIVEIRACGICRSDWHGWNGTDPDIALPHVGGHEFAGVIVEVGPDCARRKVGERVTAPFILGCGICQDCLHGDATICDHQYVVGFSGFGAFAERLAVPHADFNLVRLPNEIDFNTAASMGCRVTTAYRGLVERARLQPGEWLAIHGVGGVGMSALLVARAIGAKVLAIDVNEDALEMARRLGATATLNASQCDDVATKVREITSGGADVSVDALGITTTFHNSINGLRKLGRHVQIGMPLGDHAMQKLPLLDLVYARQITIVGTRGMAAKGFGGLFDMISNGALDPSQLITSEVSLDMVGEVLNQMNTYSGYGIAIVNKFSVK